MSTNKLYISLNSNNIYMTTVDYKKIIDGLKWVRSPEEMELAAAVQDAARNDIGKLEELLAKFTPIKTEPPLRQAGLEQPVRYAFQARAGYEVIALVNEMGKKLREEYSLHPSGQSGIGLDWERLNKRIWVPAYYLEANGISENARSIFSHDEKNCFYPVETPDDQDLIDRVINGPDSYGSSQAKIDALLSNPEWRESAKEYTRKLLYHAGTRYKGTIKQEFIPVMEALVAAYQSEMV